MMLYIKLASAGIRKNKNLYLPYILSCIVAAMIFFILKALSCSEYMAGAKALVLELGASVMQIFAAIFLIYSNSFLIKRRYKEFGLYSILGMDKRRIGLSIFIENLIVAVLCLLVGLTGGIVFSKLAELGLANLTGDPISYDFTLDYRPIVKTLIVFGPIYLVILILSLIRVWRSKPLELMKNEAVGEKAPKGNLFIGLIGLVMIGIGYYLSVMIKNSYTLIEYFFYAILMVIVGTYLLFIAGSVSVCRLLQKKKNFYYQRKNFVSLSSMTYRMKRNGAGLAGICIMSCMVLVLVSTTTCLFKGMDNTIYHSIGDYDVLIENYVSSVDVLTPEYEAGTKATIQEQLESSGIVADEVTDFSYLTIDVLTDGESFEPRFVSGGDNSGFSRMSRNVYFMELETYNRLTGESLTLEADECYVGSTKDVYKGERITFEPLALQVKGEISQVIHVCSTDMTLSQAPLMIVIKEYEIIKPMVSKENSIWESSLWPMYIYGIKTKASAETQMTAMKTANMNRPLLYGEGTVSSRFNCRADVESGVRGVYGSMLYIGLFLSAAFILSTALVLYYKQVAEGLEDRKRFTIMQKVGMTKTDIKQSINRQMATVFYAPLLVAGSHFIFASPYLRRFMEVFNIRDKGMFVTIAICTFIVFCVVYAVIYKLAARSYFRIVSHME